VASSLFRKKAIPPTDQASGGATEGLLSRHLGVRDLTAMGIAAIIGAGIFSTIGNASANGGPAVVLLFVFTAIACGFSAMAYAEFASRIPLSGSAYTYSYVVFGELIAWIIGWALIMEYAIGNIAVAISWSDYFTGLLKMMNIPLLGIRGIHVPEYLCMDYLSAYNAYHNHFQEYSRGMLNNSAIIEGILAWQNAPGIGGFKLIFDAPALFIIVLITYLVYRGIRESKMAGNAMVVVKLAVVLLVICTGFFFVDTRNWSPFAPNGMGGVLKGISAVFFACIGFDALSTTAEECRNPQRDLPRGMLYSILICTVLYVLIALVLTGMVPYYNLAVGDPLAHAFAAVNLNGISGIISMSAVVAMAGVLLVFQLGQPRIWMSMSRDGLLPPVFAKIHPRYKTPWFSTIVTGFVVAIPALFLNLTAVTDLCSIGTLFAFVMVCGGVLVLEKRKDAPAPRFKIPYINAGIWYPFIFVGILSALLITRTEAMQDFLLSRKLKSPESFVGALSSPEQFEALKKCQDMNLIPLSYYAKPNVLINWLNSLSYGEQTRVMQLINKESQTIHESGWEVFRHLIPVWIFIITALVFLYLSVRHRLSLIPLTGLLSCLYMMSELGISNWIGFAFWLIAGLVIYFLYGHRHSLLNKA
jgi:amino acid transporter